LLCYTSSNIRNILSVSEVIKKYIYIYNMINSDNDINIMKLSIKSILNEACNSNGQYNIKYFNLI